MNDKPQPPTTNVIPIGKYKGRTVEEIEGVDPQYLEWLSAQPWFVAKYVAVHQTIINRGAESEETPEHNSIQVKFLDDDFCMRLLLAVMPDADNKCADKIREDNEENYRFLNAKIEHNFDQGTAKVILDRLQNNPLDTSIRVYREFEKNGIDVILRFFGGSKAHNLPDYDPSIPLGFFRWPETYYEFSWRESYWKRKLMVEIKPTIGDDYPAVLRQMRRTGSDVLVVGSYTGKGATREQFVATMKSAGIVVVFLADV